MNISCKEFELDDLTAITAIPVGNIPAGDKDSPANGLEATVPAGLFSPSVQDPAHRDDPTKVINNPYYDNAVTIGLQQAAAQDVLIPIRRGTGKAKDDESDGVAGRLHTVSASCHADDRESEVWGRLLALERTPSHLLLTFRGGARAFVSATRDTYQCTVERDGGKTSVTFRIQDLMGIRLLA